MFLAGKRILVSWIMHGLGSGSRRSLIIGSDGWLLTNIVARSSFSAGPSIGRVLVGTLHPQMNFLMRLSLGLEIRILGWERPGKRAQDSRSSSRIVEPCLFWMAWSRSKIRLVHKKGAYVSLHSRRFCANSLP